MKPSLQLKYSQQLTLTPQLQQSIRLLQMSTLEMDQELERILRENPLLERTDDPLDACMRIAPNGGIDQAIGSGTDGNADAQAQAEPAGTAGPDDTSAEPGADRGDEIERGGDWSGDGVRRTRSDGEEAEFPQVAAAETTLREHLLDQLAATRCGPRDRALVELLIDDLDDDGFLESSRDEILAMLPDELEIEADELLTALRLLQSFDPAGVGAADLRESLLLQLRRTEPAAQAPAAVRELATRLVSDHLGLLAGRDFTRLKRILRCTEDELRDAQALVVALDPRPGAAFGGGEARFVVPDVMVRRQGAGWTVSLNGDVIPKLRIHDLYANILRRNRGAHANMTVQLQEARWLIKNVQQRFDTILRVSQAIVDRQKAFFSHGEVAMRPLVLREIAETLGLHESTVSRVTTQKYMLTPHGTFELKYFFGSHVATDSGGAASSTAIRALIKQLVAAEDSRQPLSDNQIAETLSEQGIVVARRTVAKYRESMRIPPVSQRKSL
ncbi:MAG: RNA polymerase factor sigma-54 [Burkholderiaceae bacterium]